MELTPDQIWMRDPVLQCREELIYYGEGFEFIVRDLEQIKNINGVITEGAAYVPRLMGDAQIPGNRYISITPTKEFQLFHFRKRTFVPYILRGCGNMEKAFDNWMERDILQHCDEFLDCSTHPLPRFSLPKRLLSFSSCLN